MTFSRTIWNIIIADGLYYKYYKLNWLNECIVFWRFKINVFSWKSSFFVSDDINNLSHSKQLLFFEQLLFLLKKQKKNNHHHHCFQRWSSLDKRREKWFPLFCLFCISAVYLFVCLFVCLLCISVVYLFVCLFVCLSVMHICCLSVCLFVCLSVCLLFVFCFLLNICRMRNGGKNNNIKIDRVT